MTVQFKMQTSLSHSPMHASKLVASSSFPPESSIEPAFWAQSRDRAIKTVCIRKKTCSSCCIYTAKNKKENLLFLLKPWVFQSGTLQITQEIAKQTRTCKTDSNWNEMKYKGITV